MHHSKSFCGSTGSNGGEGRAEASTPPAAGCVVAHSTDELGERNCLCGMTNECIAFIRSMYLLSVELSQEIAQVRSIPQHFGAPVAEKRAELTRFCFYAIFTAPPCAARKARQVLWACYGDLMSYISENWYRDSEQMSLPANLEKLNSFLINAISGYKRMALETIQAYGLDLRYTIDMSLLEDGEDEQLTRQMHSRPVDRLKEESFACATVYSALLSLGDLHHFGAIFSTEASLQLSPQSIANFYVDAFMLNPAVGKAHNQLGVLCSGHNYELDAAYHFIYSLVCRLPFTPSEMNLRGLPMPNAYYELQDPASDAFFKNHFYARFYTIVHAFFFDREVPDLNQLCQHMLLDLHRVLLNQPDLVPPNNLFRVVAILLFCLSKLKKTESSKVHFLNAFLLDITLLFMDACTTKLEQALLENLPRIYAFHCLYEFLFEEFQMTVHTSQKDYKKWLALEKQNTRSAMRGATRLPTVPRLCLCDSRDTLGAYHLPADSASDGGKESDGKPRCQRHGDKKMRWNRCVPSDGGTSSSETDTGSETHEEGDKLAWLSETGDPLEAPDINGISKTFFSCLGELAPSKPKVLKLRRKYDKVAPNIIIDFARQESTLPCLKILFEWLRNCPELFSTFSDSKLLQKTVKLLNHLNIDLFSRRVFFEHKLFYVTDVRRDLRSLYKARKSIPITEDFVFKSFDLFQQSQARLNWPSMVRAAVTPSEWSILRIFKMVDFGHFMCRQNKARVRFCARTRKFVEIPANITAVSPCQLRRAANTTRESIKERTRRFYDRQKRVDHSGTHEWRA